MTPVSPLPRRVAFAAALACVGLVASFGAMATEETLPPLPQDAPFTRAELALPDLDHIDASVADLVRERYRAIVTAADADEAPELARAVAALAVALEANDLWAPAAHSWQVALSTLPHDAVPDPVWRFHHALCLRESGAMVEATASLVGLNADTPDLPYVLHRLGEALTADGRLDEAAEVFEALASLLPDSPHGHAGLGEVRLAQQRYEAATAALERAVAVAPGYRHARYMLGLAYRAGGNREAALDELRRGVEAIRSYVPDPLSADLAQATVNAPARRNVAASLLNAGRAEQAAQVLERLFVDGLAELTDINNLAVAYLKLNRLDDAESLLLQIADMAPRDFATQLNLVSLAERRRDMDGALRHAVAAVELAPRVARTHQALARVQARRGEWAAAEASLATASTLDARDPQLAAMHGDVLARLGRFDEAERRFIRAVELYPDFLPGLLSLARLRLQARDLSGAVDWYRRALAIAPENGAVASIGQAIERARTTADDTTTDRKGDTP